MSGKKVTKAELTAFVDAVSKQAATQEKTAEALVEIVEQNEKIVARLYNGMTKDFVSEVEKICANCKENTCKEHKLQKEQIDKIEGYTYWTNIFFGILALAGVISLAIQQAIHWFGHYNVPK